MNIVFLGPPGSGKGTLAKKLVEAGGFLHIAAGDLLREEVFKKSAPGEEINKFISQGLLVPDRIIVRLIKNKIVAEGGQAADLILDGFPRSLEQARALEEMLGELKTKIDGVIYFKVSQEEAVSRLSGRLNCPKCGAVYHKTNLPPKVNSLCDVCGSELIVRNDDQPQTIKNRYQVYEKQTRPLIEYYTEKKNIFLLDAAAGVNQIFENLIKIIRSLKNDHHQK